MTLMRRHADLKISGRGPLTWTRSGMGIRIQCLCIDAADPAKVPEGKAVKNRLHLDLRPAEQSAEVARLCVQR
jgi:hypothetical protein